MGAVTLDTGALVALERKKPRADGLLRASRERGVALFTITPALTEWWRGRTDLREAIARVVRVVPLPVHVARSAGEALGTLRGRGAGLAVDVMVVAFAAAEGGQVVYTSDVAELERIAAACFPAVKVLGI